MEIFLINLDRRVDRLTAVQNQLEMLGLEATRISAVDGGAKDVSEALGQNDLSSPEVAVALSHRAVWQRIVDSNQPYALVIEDDIIFAPSIVAVLKNPNFYNTCDLLHLETVNIPAWVSTKVQYQNEGISVTEMLTSILGSACYIISKEHAARLLSELQSIYVPIDTHMFDRQYFTRPLPIVMQADPAPAMQAAFFRNKDSLPFSKSDISDALFARVKKAEANSSESAYQHQLSALLRKRHGIGHRAVAWILWDRKLRRIPFDTRI